MRAQVIHDHDRKTPAGPRAGHGGTHLRTKDIGGAAGGETTVKPPVAPVDEPEAIDLVVGTRRLDEALPAPAFAAPDTGEGRMEYELDLVLEIDVGTWQEVDQLVHIGRHVTEEVGFNEFGHGWRGWRASPGQDHLHPQAFPT